ncbi:MAG: Ig-like domain-containing protein, partial [Gemmatimonadetes bacterium]|nr:Ig-like domain-containing protein [Gemmatimonadota bacterium]
MRTAGRRTHVAWVMLVLGAFSMAACEDGPFLVSGVVIGSLNITPGSLVIALEEADSVTLQVFDENGVALQGQNASWVSENPAVATVEGRDAGATVTAVAEGTTRIQVTVGQVVE